MIGSRETMRTMLLYTIYAKDVAWSSPFTDVAMSFDGSVNWVVALSLRAIAPTSALCGGADETSDELT